MKVATAKEQSERVRQNEKKRTKELVAAGWTVVPSIILEKQHALGLGPIDVNILMHLARHWWYSDNLPHPAKGTIAACMGVSVSTVRRHIAQLESDGLIRREVRYGEENGRQETNRYHFDGLIKAATPHALETLRLREQRRAADAERRRRKKPNLSIIHATRAPEGSDR